LYRHLYQKLFLRWVVVASTWLLKQVGLWSALNQILTNITLVEATLAIFITWIAGILLMVLNREVYRFLEGYGKYNPLQLLEKRAKQGFKKRLEPVMHFHKT
jgi:hypothetical protein